MADVILTMSWQEYEDAVGKIIANLATADIRVDAIVGISRAGLPLTTSISSALSISDVGVIFMRRTLSDEPFSTFYTNARMLGFAIPFSLVGRSVLLLDNVVHSGMSMYAATQLLNEHGAGSVICGALARYELEYKFDLIAPIKLGKQEWVVWPWDKRRLSTYEMPR